MIDATLGIETTEVIIIAISGTTIVNIGKFQKTHLYGALSLSLLSMAYDFLFKEMTEMTEMIECSQEIGTAETGITITATTEIKEIIEIIGITEIIEVQFNEIRIVKSQNVR